jgi:hypothetical protein
MSTRTRGDHSSTWPGLPTHPPGDARARTATPASGLTTPRHRSRRLVGVAAAAGGVVIAGAAVMLTLVLSARAPSRYPPTPHAWVQAWTADV